MQDQTQGTAYKNKREIFRGGWTGILLRNYGAGASAIEIQVPEYGDDFNTEPHSPPFSCL